ncbi:MAG: glycoside hydrolase family 25 protein [Saprospiraceae bacterium]
MRKNIYYIILLLFLMSCDKETERLTGYEIHGLDVSHYQSKVNWDEVAANDIHFTFVKATEGEELKDSLFANNWKDLKRVGIKRGAYHFFRPTLSPLQQARNFIQAVKLEPGDLPPVLDVEVTNNASTGVITTRIRTWLEIMEMHYCVRPIIYTNLNFYKKYIAEEFQDYPIWIARYNYAEPGLSNHDQWQFWQYGNRGRIPGVNGDVDFNVFHGTLEELSKLGVQPPVDVSDVAAAPY